MGRNQSLYKGQVATEFIIIIIIFFIMFTIIFVLFLHKITYVDDLETQVDAKYSAQKIGYALSGVSYVGNGTHYGLVVPTEIDSRNTSFEINTQSRMVYYLRGDVVVGYPFFSGTVQQQNVTGTIIVAKQGGVAVG